MLNVVTCSSGERSSSACSHRGVCGSCKRPTPTYTLPLLVGFFLKRLPNLVPKAVPLSRWRMLLVFPQAV